MEIIRERVHFPDNTKKPQMRLERSHFAVAQKVGGKVIAEGELFRDDDNRGVQAALDLLVLVSFFQSGMGAPLEEPAHSVTTIPEDGQPHLLALYPNNEFWVRAEGSPNKLEQCRHHRNDACFNSP